MSIINIQCVLFRIDILLQIMQIHGIHFSNFNAKTQKISYKNLFTENVGE